MAVARSADFDAALNGPSPRVNTRADIIVDGQVVAQVPLTSRTVTADRTAARMRSFEIDIPGAAYAANSLDDLLAPGNTHVQLFDGVRVEDETSHGIECGVGLGWAVSNLSTGVVCSLVDDGFGGLTLGGDATSVTIEPPVENDFAQAIGFIHIMSVGQASEDDTAGTIAPAVPVTQAVETDSANPIVSVPTVLVGQASETDTAQTITPTVLVGVGQAVETDTALAISPGSATPFPDSGLFPDSGVLLEN